MTASTGDLPRIRPAGAHRATPRGWLRRLAANIYAVLTGRAR